MTKRQYNASEQIKAFKKAQNAHRIEVKEVNNDVVVFARFKKSDNEVIYLYCETFFISPRGKITYFITTLER